MSTEKSPSVLNQILLHFYHFYECPRETTFLNFVGLMGRKADRRTQVSLNTCDFPCL